MLLIPAALHFTVKSLLHVRQLCTAASSSAGKAAERAVDNKIAKYNDLISTYDFIPVAFETLGPLCDASARFLCSLGRKLASVTGDVRQSSFLFQILRMTIQ